MIPTPLSHLDFHLSYSVFFFPSEASVWRFCFLYRVGLGSFFFSTSSRLPFFFFLWELDSATDTTHIRTSMVG